MIAGSSVPVATIHSVRKNKNHKKEKRTIPSVALKQANVTDEPWHELAMGPKADTAFFKAATKAKTKMGDKGVTLHVRDPEALGNSKKFLSKDGRSGFAITATGDIVSIFNSSDRRNASVAALMLAVQNGGTRLSVYDVGTPHIYALAGFQEVGRQAMTAKSQARTFTNTRGWNKKFFEDRGFTSVPDIVRMEYEPTSNGMYTPGGTP